MRNRDSRKIEIASIPEPTQIDTIKKPNLPIGHDRYEKCLWPYVLSLPFMWLITIYVMLKKKIYRMLGLGMPETNCIFFDGLGKESRKLKDCAKSWRAMEIVYHHPFAQKKTPGGVIDEFYWFGLNCQGLRNRLKLVKAELRKAVSTVADDKEIRLVSLACGSAESVIEIMAEAKAKNKIIRAIFVDIDGDALESAKSVARYYGIENQIKMLRGSISDVIESCREFKPQIVEIMGFLDYVEQNEAIFWVGKIREILEPDGYLITCNIAPNMEQHFLKWVINWPMVYRSPEKLGEIARESGFDDYRLIYEPLMVHGLLVAQKK